MSNFMQFWSALQQRERNVISLGALLVLLTAGYLVFDKIWSTRASLLLARSELQAEAVWMQEQAEIAEQLVNSCSDPQILPLPPGEIIDLLASRSRLSIRNISMNGSNYSLEISASAGNNILQFIHQSACQGFNLTDVSISQEDTSAYLGQVELSHEG